MTVPAQNGSTTSTATIVLIVVGVIAGLFLLTCIGVFVAGSMLTMPALDQARERAHALRSAIQLRQIEMSIEVSAQDEEGQARSLDELLDRQYITVDLLTSPAGPIEDGDDDYWLEFERPDPDDLDDPASYVVSYDRAMYALGRFVPACKFNGECDVYEVEEFEQLLNSPVNEGRDFNLPERQRVRVE